MNFSFSLVSEGVETLPQAIVGPPEGTETLRTIRGSLSSPDRSQPLVLDDAIATKISVWLPNLPLENNEVLKLPRDGRRPRLVINDWF